MTIYFLLGVILGSIISTSCLTLVYIVLCNNLARVKQVVKKIEYLGKNKGVLINPVENTVKKWIDDLPSG